jgi:ATP-dependent Lon protease
MSIELIKTEPPSPEDQQQVNIPDTLPVLPLPDAVVFPYMILPLFVNRDKGTKAVDQSLAENRMILLVAQKNANIDDPKAEDLHKFGTVSVIMRMLKLPDGRVRILVQGLSRAEVESYDESKPYLVAKIIPKAEATVTTDSVELEALIRNVKGSLEKAVSLVKNI